MVNRRLITVIALFFFVSVLLAGILVLSIQNRESYEAAKKALEQHEVQVISTVIAATNTAMPTDKPYPSVTPLSTQTSSTGSSDLILPTKVN